jgi:hypothetical protein
MDTMDTEVEHLMRNGKPGMALVSFVFSVSSVSIVSFVPFVLTTSR